jgi:hypothetical protein
MEKEKRKKVDLKVEIYIVEEYEEIFWRESTLILIHKLDKIYTIYMTVFTIKFINFILNQMKCDEKY